MKNCCPIETTLSYIGKKWSLNIIRDLYSGKKHFSEFLESNPTLSTKVLSTRLKELEKQQIIEKKIVNTNPITIEYHLTKKGLGLNRILYELAMFSIQYCPSEVKHLGPKEQCCTHMQETFGIKCSKEKGQKV